VSIVVLLLPLLVLVIGAVAIAARASRAAAPAKDFEGLRAIARTTRLWRILGLASGLAASALVLNVGLLGRGMLLAAPVAALCILAGILIGELRVTAPAGPVRSAGLEIRRVRDHLPRRLFAAVSSSAVLLGVVLLATTSAGSPDDMGRPGRWLVRRCDATVTEARGPWPGSFYTAPVALLVLCGLSWPPSS
jgi:hypothetical protein